MNKLEKLNNFWESPKMDQPGIPKEKPEEKEQTPPLPMPLRPNEQPKRRERTEPVPEEIPVEIEPAKI